MKIGTIIPLFYYFGSLRKSSKRSANVAECKNDLPAFFDFLKSSEVFGSLQKSPDVFGNLRKISEIATKCLK